MYSQPCGPQAESAVDAHFPFLAETIAAMRPSWPGVTGHKDTAQASHDARRAPSQDRLIVRRIMPKTHTDMVAAVFRTIFAQPDAATVAATWDEVRDQLAGPFPKIGTLMDAAKADVFGVHRVPRPHWPRIWTTNPLERVNKEIKRRARVGGIFPNEADVVPLVRATAQLSRGSRATAGTGPGGAAWTWS
jgi:Transposase, Mutator family